ncbi:ribonuclease H-like domain-containing protein [Penicillium verhagenii]|uniref:ribonuclease H-like domain-containing protein n=1 Tax=Penicillium verhagenii TaxID=1562060 RepID=UPI002545B8F4|nr:ribonuclease H-like domain-containing protein [Penicillium verhagenii]KAJ5918604.1 ribonuclease H-like domain-containing protein [Penicillium verhagenii]
MTSSCSGNASTTQIPSTAPTIFTLPVERQTWQSLFLPVVGSVHTQNLRRFINRTNIHQFLIFTTGLCHRDARGIPSAGCSFVFGLHATLWLAGYGRFHLERRGPNWDRQVQTSNRAELRAVIGALQYKDWTEGGFNSMVIATDSEYVILGITSRVWGWVNNGWQTTEGLPVENRDLWELLLDEIEGYRTAHMEIQFWPIPREWNSAAVRHARSAARSTTSEHFRVFEPLAYPPSHPYHYGAEP